jgi:hypothetical protein
VEAFEFDFVCARCFAPREVLESPELPRTCPSCGAAGSWIGPVALTALDRFSRADGEAIVDSPLYLAAQTARRAR